MNILLNKEEFFKRFDCKKIFDDSGLSWENLSDIYDSYNETLERLNNIKDNLVHFLQEKADFPYHSIHGRVKNAEHLIEKIIRKVGIEQSGKYREINASNYCEIIRDLIGIRILSLNKENWELVYLFLKKMSENSVLEFAENPIAYTRYGDRDIYKDKIHEEHTNKGYRSQHYIVKFEGVYCEIQARTLAEEVFGEFDHKVKYPYRNSNAFLRRLSSIASQHLDAVDELISTGLTFSDSALEQLGKEFVVDEYRDWKTISKPQHPRYETEVSTFKITPESNEDQYILAGNYISYNLLRKGRKQK